MKIIVCIKQVPDTEASIVSNGKTIDESAVSSWILNPYDEFAVEEAVKLKEAAEDVEVVAVSLGPERAEEVFQTALAMGADRGIHIVTDEFHDPALVAAALAAAIHEDGMPELVFTGTYAIDDNACQVHLRLAHLLEASAAINVSDFLWADGGAEVTRDVAGAEERLFLPAPAVVAVTKGINKPRYPTLPNIMKARKKEILRKEVSDLGLDASLPAMQVMEIEAPEEFTGGRILKGENSDTVSELVDLLRNQAGVV